MKPLEENIFRQKKHYSIDLCQDQDAFKDLLTQIQIILGRKIHPTVIMIFMIH